MTTTADNDRRLRAKVILERDFAPGRHRFPRDAHVEPFRPRVMSDSDFYVRYYVVRTARDHLFARSFPPRALGVTPQT